MSKIDISKLNKQLNDEVIKKIVLSLGGEITSENNEQIIFTSICHHINASNHKPKLYYYKNGSFFVCYSCSSSGDIYWLVQKRKKILGEKINFPQAIEYICSVANIKYNKSSNSIKAPKDIFDWSELKKFLPNNRISKENKIYDSNIIDCLDEKYHTSFLDDYISIETMQKFRIKFYERKQQVCIPVFNDNSDFIGIHARNLLPETIENGYKYLPLKLLTDVEYKFNTSNVLFGLNLNKMFIQNSKTVIITEAPKGVMQLDSFGVYNSVGLFGRTLQKEKRELLLKYNVENVYIALDKQYHLYYNDKDEKTEEFELYEQIVMKIVNSLQPYVQNIYVIYDKDEDNFLDYCDSPMDKGKEIWQKLLDKAEKVV